MTVRAPRLGYLLRTFPVLSETFVAAEIQTVAALTGQPPAVAALHAPGTGQAGGWRPDEAAALLYWNDIDKRRLPQLACSHARLLAGSPAKTLGCLFRPQPYAPTWKSRVKAAALAAFFLDRGVTHLHSHFAWEQTEMLAYLHRLTGIPFSLTVHAADIFVSPVGLARRLQDAAFVATISAVNKALLCNDLGLPEDKVHVVHCGVDLTDFPFEPATADAPAKLISIGRMVPKKGFDVLLKALALLRDQGQDVETELVGDGPLRPELERLAGQLRLGATVRFLGSLEPVETAARLRRSHALVLACRQGPDGDKDGIPVALMEAMALGRPVVSTALSGIPELLGDGCGLMARPDDPHSLAESLRQVLTDTALAGRLSRAGRTRVEEAFTLTGQARRIINLAARSQAGART